MSSPEITDAGIWQRELGLLPVPLYPVVEAQMSFVLLDGPTGSFCLDFRPELSATDARSESWSSNVGHHVLVRDTAVIVRRWDSPQGQEQKFPTRYVASKLPEFHAWLTRESARPEGNVVSHLLNTFRRTRSALPQQTSGTTALSAFLYLIACATDETSRSHLDAPTWNLDEEALSAALEIDEGTWDGLIAELRQGRRLERLEARLPLVLRHAAGAVFQEAHFVVAHWEGAQVSLPGFAPMASKVIPRPLGVGVHFTPPPLARVVVEEALNALGDLPSRITAFDPASGSGEFLRELIRQLQIRGFTGSLELTAWDIADAACKMSAFVLGWEAHRAGFPVKVTVTRRDALDGAPWPADTMLLLMNPPFLSWRDMDASHQKAARDALGALAKERTDLSMAFVWKAAQSVGAGGILGTIVPASILDGSSASTLRASLAEILSPAFIARLGSQDLFPFARVDAGVYVGKRSNAGSPEDTVLFWADHRSSSTSEGLRNLRRIRASGTESELPVQRAGYSIYASDRFGTGALTWAPRPFREWQTLQAASHHRRAHEIFSIRQGALTGLNSVFILSSKDLTSLPRNERKFFRPAVLNESVSDGTLSKVAYVFYPYGENAIESEHELARQLPSYFEGILAPQKEDLSRRAGIETKGWWLLTRPRPEGGAGKTKIVSTYFGDAGSFAWDDAGDFVVVQGYAWLPRGKRFTKAVWLAYLAVLNSTVMASLLAASSNNVGGGQWNLSKRYVKDIPLPDLASPLFPPDLLRDLSEVGEQMHRAKYETSDQSSAKLTELAEAAYSTELTAL
jgi:adenine-specific DNA-methyltransferase